MTSPLKLVEGGVTAPQGFEAAGVRCGIKERGRDLALVFSRRPAVAAGVFTSNLFAAAPVQVSRERIQAGAAQAVVLNSGCANACTGEQGLENAREMAALAARGLGIFPEAVLVGSTGLIGPQLPMDRVVAGIGAAVDALSSRGGHQAARAIMTTDTVPKEISVEVRLGERPVRVGGMAKGVGMLAPNMATMLCVLTTDADIERSDLDISLRWSVDRSFNSITVDGDMSTNDTCVILANGLSGVAVRTQEQLQQFQSALDFATSHLARAIIMDGEGATKLVEVTVRGAASYEDARKAAFTIANSPLVKTALFGEDPNWGRILAAAGRAGVALDPARAELALCSVPLVKDGVSLEFDPEQMHQALGEREVSILLDLHQGPLTATVWTCDLSYKYVRINARYHT